MPGVIYVYTADENVKLLTFNTSVHPDTTTWLVHDRFLDYPSALEHYRSYLWNHRLHMPPDTHTMFIFVRLTEDKELMFHGHFNDAGWHFLLQRTGSTSWRLDPQTEGTREHMLTIEDSVKRRRKERWSDVHRLSLYEENTFMEDNRYDNI